MSYDTSQMDNYENTIVQPLLTDMYQLSMAYVYWKTGKMNDPAVFDLFFRKNPFNGEFTIFAGLNDCLKFINRFRYSTSDIDYLKSVMPSETDSAFFKYLSDVTTENVSVYAVDEGTVVFPKVPLLRIEGPLVVVQLLETTLLTLVNFASLVATNAVRYRLAAGNDMRLLEFGLRRAQGPDGGLTASKYAFIGGFDATSNVLAGKLFNIPVAGTHAHSFITSFTGMEELQLKLLSHKETGHQINFLELAMNWREKLISLMGEICETNDGELAAFVSYAISFPNQFIALVDTYDVKRTGLINFCAVALALNDLEYKAIGIRIDSGDLAYLSHYAQCMFVKVSEAFSVPCFKKLMIMVSNDLNEETILSLNDQKHEIKGFGIGTHLVTCQKQPALGCVFKMVEVNKCPRMKISQEFSKMSLPGRKDVFRIYNDKGFALIDLMQTTDEVEPTPHMKVLCRHPFDRSKRCYVIPERVEKLHKIYWQDGKICKPMPTLEQIKTKVQDSLSTLRPDIKRSLNPTPYKLAVSEVMFNFIQNLWLENAPIGELV